MRRPQEEGRSSAIHLSWECVGLTSGVILYCSPCCLKNIFVTLFLGGWSSYCAHQSMRAEVGEQLAGVGSLLPHVDSGD